jgi:hypothetical protein
MAPYETKVPPALEDVLEDQGFDLSAEVIPSRAGVPVATGLSAEQWLEESSKFFDSDELDPTNSEDDRLLEDLAAS